MEVLHSSTSQLHPLDFQVIANWTPQDCSGWTWEKPCQSGGETVSLALVLTRSSSQVQFRGKSSGLRVGRPTFQPQRTSYTPRTSISPLSLVLANCSNPISILVTPE